MSTQPTTSAPTRSLDRIRQGQRIIRTESVALDDLAQRLPAEFDLAVTRILACRGSLILCGMGKAGLIGAKIAATMGSLGFPSHVMHPGEAIHGDLGRVASQDLVILLSYSGESEEVVRILSPLKQRGIELLAITGNPDSSLARAADLTLCIGRVPEACPLGLAPSTSTSMMLAVGDALALVAGQERGFQREDFARYHPGGSLGRQLAAVDELMRPLAECRIATEDATVRSVIVATSRPGRRTGAVMLVGTDGRLTGLFTDSDLARLLEQQADHALDLPISSVMTQNPATLTQGMKVADAVDVLAHRKISEIPVCDSMGYPVGLIDITDIMSWTAEGPEATTPMEREQHAGDDEPEILPLRPQPKE